MAVARHPFVIACTIAFVRPWAVGLCAQVLVGTITLMTDKEGATRTRGHPGRRVGRAAIVRPPRGSARFTRSLTGSRERRRPYVGVVTGAGVSTPLLVLNVRATMARVACVRAFVATTRTVNAANAVACTGTERRTVSAP
jgi:uncharacterized membrane protein